MKGSDEQFEVMPRNWPDVALFPNLIRDNSSEFLCEFSDGISIGRGLSGDDDGKINNETETKACDDMGVFLNNPGFLQRCLPSVWVIRRESLTLSELEGMCELRERPDCIQSKNACCRAWY